jgi:hypothetical protein
MSTLYETLSDLADVYPSAKPALVAAYVRVAEIAVQEALEHILKAQRQIEADTPDLQMIRRAISDAISALGDA